MLNEITFKSELIEIIQLVGGRGLYYNLKDMNTVWLSVFYKSIILCTQCIFDMIAFSDSIVDVSRYMIINLHVAKHLKLFW